MKMKNKPVWRAEGIPKTARSHISTDMTVSVAMIFNTYVPKTELILPSSRRVMVTGYSKGLAEKIYDQAGCPFRPSPTGAMSASKIGVTGESDSCSSSINRIAGTCCTPC
jgi:homoaconitase/3-isopropylmalate dehydratase large subunit